MRKATALQGYYSSFFSTERFVVKNDAKNIHGQPFLSLISDFLLNSQTSCPRTSFANFYSKFFSSFSLENFFNLQ